MSKELNIKVSEKYGLNPSMERCFFCGETKGIAFMGKLEGDVEAPKFVILNYEPCDKCKEQFNKGVTCIEVANEPIMPGQPEIREGLYPTSRLAVIKVEAAIDLFADADDGCKDLKEGNSILINPGLFEQLFVPKDQEQEQKQEQE